jgi:hypothetical protein
MHLLLILALAVLFPAVHILNGWLFDFATITNHISLIYLPAFLRLFNLLILGPVFGSLTTFLGGLLLIMQFNNESMALLLLYIVCSCTGPLLSLWLFKFTFKRNLRLSSLRDLTILVITYSFLNAVLHSTVWLFVDSSETFSVSGALWMFVGDFNGALLGAYLMKALVDAVEIRGLKLSSSSQPKN